MYHNYLISVAAAGEELPQQRVIDNHSNHCILAEK